MKLLDFEVGADRPIFLIAGPCVIESEAMAMSTATTLKELTSRLGIPFIYKSSFDKANRSSHESYRGPGLSKGLEILAQVKDRFGLPITTDIHDPSQAGPVAEVADLVQIPAFLCRQTDLLVAAGDAGKPVNIKKGQFAAPADMEYAIAKVGRPGEVMVTERGTTFGYGDLVVDMRAIVDLAELGVPVVFDATHSAQKPGGRGDRSGGHG